MESVGLTVPKERWDNKGHHENEDDSGCRRFSHIVVMGIVMLIWCKVTTLSVSTHDYILSTV